MWPCADEEVRLALDAACQDGSWGRYDGEHCEALVERLTTMHSVAHAMVCCSGTFAVELALRGLQIRAGDEVILAGYDFGGNFRCVEAVGARPVLVDIDPETWCLDVRSLADAITDQTRCVLVSHLHGGIADMKSICEMAADNNLRVVEDACQSPSAEVQGKPAGTWGDIGVLSFGGSKLLTAGRGGAIVTNHADVAQRAKIYCERGNNAYPLSEIQAAVLAPQIEKLSDRNHVRLQRVAQLRERLGVTEGLRMIDHPDEDSSPVYYKVAFDFDADLREKMICAMQAEGIAIDAGFRGFTRRSKNRCRKVGDLAHSQRAADATLVLHHPVLLEERDVIDRVASGIEKVVSSTT